MRRRSSGTAAGRRGRRWAVLPCVTGLAMALFTRSCNRVGPSPSSDIDLARLPSVPSMVSMRSGRSGRVWSHILMSTTQVGRGLEAHGVQSSKPVHLNLSAASLYEHAIRRQEGLLAAEGPLVCRTGAHTGRSPNDKFVVQEPSSEAHICVGQGQPADRRGAVRRAARATSSAHLERQGAVRPGLLRRRRSRRTGCRSASSPNSPGTTCSCRNLFIVPIRPADLAGVQPAVHRHRRAELQGRPGAARHALRRRASR